MTVGVAILVGLGALFGLCVLSGAVWAVIRTSALQTSNDRLRNEAEDYLRRLGFLEPRVDVLERENRTLRDLHNPAEAISDIAAKVGRLADQEGTNHRETIDVLNQIDAHLRGAK